jgi:hypothetical protein
MSSKKRSSKSSDPAPVPEVVAYEFDDKRKNNPEVGLVSPD